MMRKFIILSTIILTTFSCKTHEKPEFVRIENFKTLEVSSKFIVIEADALFLNPNIVSGKLKTDGIKVIVNDTESATISSETFNVPAQDEFTIPLKANISLDSLMSNKNIGNLLGSLFNKTLKVQYKGAIKYTAWGFTYTYDLDKTDTIKLNN